MGDTGATLLRKACGSVAPKVARSSKGLARPPEDVGGPSGYQNFLEALLNAAHEEHPASEALGGRSLDGTG